MKQPEDNKTMELPGLGHAFVTVEMFTKFVGRAPEQDDMDRVNCTHVGQMGHHFCGWNYAKNLPVFMAGEETYRQFVENSNTQGELR